MTFTSPESSAAAALILMRLTGLLLTAPIFSNQSIPPKVKAAFLAVMTIMLIPVGLPDHALELTPVTLLSEAVIGMTLGIGAAVFVAASQASGDMLAIQMGLSGASVLDPMSQSQMPVLGQFLGLFVVTMILATGGHLVMLDSLTASMKVLPLGGELNLAQGLAEVTRIGGVVFLLGVKFAAPVVGAMLLGNVTLGIMARTVPQLNVLMVAFPVQIAVGLFAMGISLPLIASYFTAWPQHYEELVSMVLENFAPQGSR